MAKALPVRQKTLPLQQALARAAQAHQSGQLAEAEALYGQILQARPDHVEAQHLLGVLRGQQGRYPEALELVGAALRAKPDAAGARSNYALILFKLKRHDEALASFEQALALKPDNAEALNNRGNVLSELKRYEEALASYDKALALRPHYAEALNNRGNALSALERYAEALTAYDGALGLRPNYAEALANRGNVLAALGRYDEALTSYVKALLMVPDHAETHYQRGNVLAKLERYEDALRSYDKALAARPDHAETHDNRGNALAKLKRYDDALASYDRALALAPDCSEAWYNRGNALAELQRLDDALASYDGALEGRPDYVEALNGRGTVLHQLGRCEEALASYDRALALAPDDAAMLYNRGGAAQELNRHDEALASFDRALALEPHSPRALYARAGSLHVMNRWAEALDGYGQVLALKPDFAEARFAMCMAELPILYTDEAEIAERRAAYGKRLQALRDDADQAEALAMLAKGVGSRQPFFLGYQGLNDRDLQRLYGALVCRLAATQYPEAAPAPPPGPNEPVRLGLVSAFFRQHSNWKIPIKGWLSQLDRRRFRVFGYHTASQADAETEVAAGLCDRFVQGPLSVDRWREEILADAPHVLIYPEVGMDAVTAQLAAQRLAAVQCNSWGHPDTSGFPTLDYFLSSDLMEPVDGQDHYTERLIRLPNLSIYCEPFDPPRESIGRSELGLRAGSTVFWCGQSLYKYLPQFDQVFPRIAREVGDCQFAFIEYQRGTHITELFRKRLDGAFAAFGLRAADHCVVLPRLDQQRFLAAIGLSDIFLDSIGWSGCNSTLEGLTHDLPIVTMPGSLMRGRHSAAILDMIGVAETIAPTVDDYVSTAVRLARDGKWRMAVKQKIAANKHRLYRDDACIASLQQFLDRAARGPK